jgi:hypothetical protein
MNSYKYGIENINYKIFITLEILLYRKTPRLVPGIDPFSNANIFVLDQLIAETKTD